MEIVNSKKNTENSRQNTANRKRGFTLIEMLVAVAIFSIVLMIAMGAILTIVDANRKAQTLSSVMTNLNFAVESMTRTIKTGVDPAKTGTGSSQVLTVQAIDLSVAGQTDFTRREVSFQLNNGALERRIGGSGGTWIPMTAPEVIIDDLNFELIGDAAFDQPRVLITIAGTMQLSQTIRSVFNIQTTVSQRRLNVEGPESGI